VNAITVRNLPPAVAKGRTGEGEEGEAEPEPLQEASEVFLTSVVVGELVYGFVGGRLSQRRPHSTD
jgi:hypothetical protein